MKTTKKIEIKVIGMHIIGRDLVQGPEAVRRDVTTAESQVTL